MLLTYPQEKDPKRLNRNQQAAMRLVQFCLSIFTFIAARARLLKCVEHSVATFIAVMPFSCYSN
jgi:hypothetical protein